jgi:hypothetical protein
MDTVDVVLVTVAKMAPYTPRRAIAAFSSVTWANWISTTSPSYAPSWLSRVDVVERKPWAQWSPPAAVSQSMVGSALFSVFGH